MSRYYIMGIDESIAEEVRATMFSPQYGHPVVRELARGTGPCRSCLQRFEVGVEERLFFTYRPQSGSGTIGAPGPVFIHSESCDQYRSPAFPEDLYSLPIILEAWARDNRISNARRIQGSDADATLEEVFADPDVEYVHVRHGEAGCHIARVSRGVLPSAAFSTPEAGRTTAPRPSRQRSTRA